mmetsp:Transcript_7356/g.13036  ORF Transcript_7356/g.13036 Transcript_7356/m.13036 type:complete len:488 (-) Transcript_7356:108-1571(-)
MEGRPQQAQSLVHRGDDGLFNPDGWTWRESAQEVSDFESAKREKGLGFGSLVVGCGILLNTLLGGSSVLAMPKAFSTAGYLCGAGMLLTFGCFSGFACHLLQCSSVRLGHAPCSFEACSNCVLPHKLRWSIDAAVAVKCFGVACSQLVIIGDLLPPTARLLGLSGVSRSVAITAAFCVAGPLSAFPTLSALKYTSFITVLIVLWLIAMVMLFFAGTFKVCSDSDLLSSSFTESRQLVESLSLVLQPSSCAEDTPFNAVNMFDKMAVAKQLPVFIFACTCHQNVFTICNEVRKTSRRRIGMVILSSFTTVACMHTLTAIVAYRMLGNERLDGSNLLKSLPDSSVPVQVTRLLYCFVVCWAYPMQLHPCRISTLALLRAVDCTNTFAGSGSFTTRGDAWRSPAYWLITCVLVVGTYIIAMSVTSLGIVLEVVGSTGSTMVTFILPGFIYMRVFPGWHLKGVAAMFQATLGCVIMPLCMAITFMPDPHSG